MDSYFVALSPRTHGWQYKQLIFPKLSLFWLDSPLRLTSSCSSSHRLPPDLTAKHDLANEYMYHPGLNSICSMCLLGYN